MSFRDGPRYIRMDYKLELVLIPVTDVDRAKKFYLDNMGFVLIVDTAIGDGQRVVQVVPPGSECAIGFGTGITRPRPARRRACTWSCPTSSRGATNWPGAAW